MRTKKVVWYIDTKEIGTTGKEQTKFLWRLSPGTHTARAKVWLDDRVEGVDTPTVRFVVK